MNRFAIGGVISLCLVNGKQSADLVIYLSNRPNRCHVSSLDTLDQEAVQLGVTSAIRAISDEEPVGRAEALRRAILDMIDAGGPHEAHLSYWARFRGGRRGCIGPIAAPAPICRLRQQYP